MNMEIPPGMVPCRVIRHTFGPWVVDFLQASNRTLFLQTDFDQAAFAVGTGTLKAPKNWNGDIDVLGSAWEHFDPEAIQFCSDEYLPFATDE